jgi:hypothetical protein
MSGVRNLLPCQATSLSAPEAPKTVSHTKTNTTENCRRPRRAAAPSLTGDRPVVGLVDDVAPPWRAPAHKPTAKKISAAPARGRPAAFSAARRAALPAADCPVLIAHPGPPIF